MMLIVYSVLILLTLICAVLHFIASRKRETQPSGNNPTFVKFQRKYFVAYLLALSADWLQAPYLYSLYNYYGFEQAQIAVLYVCGFMSAVILGTWAPFVANNFGRRNLCIVFSVIYSISCFMKLSQDYGVLLLGRIFGGVATSLLFSSYGAWYMHEHIETHDFPREWIDVTLRKVAVWNAIVAIISGLIANLTADWLKFGPVSPFILAVPFLLISGIFVMATWEENYGEQKVSFKKAVVDALREIADSKKIVLVGAIQSLFESVFYIFIFLWTPVLQSVSEKPQLGLVFANFMVCIMIGGVVHELATKRISNIMCLTAAISTAFLASCAVAIFANPMQLNIAECFIAFLCYEIAVGLYFPAMAHIQQQLLPQIHSANIIALFRVPLNIIASIVLLLLHDENFRHGNRFIFVICAVLLCVALICTSRLAKLLS